MIKESPLELLTNKNLLKQLFGFFLFPIIILVIHGILSILNVYRTIWWSDIVMHFIGGVAIGRSYFLLLKLVQKKGYLGNTHTFIFFIFVISLVGLTIVAWEFLEFSSDYLFNTNAQPSLDNTIQDMFLGLIGGLSGYFIIKKS